MYMCEGWHILSPDGRLEYGDGRPVHVGQTLEAYAGCNKFRREVARRPATHTQLCATGMHASGRLRDAIGYYGCRAGILCRVVVWGDLRDGGSKFVGTHRKVLWAVRVSAEEMLEFLWRVSEEGAVRRYFESIEKDRIITSGCLKPEKSVYAKPKCATTACVANPYIFAA